MMAFKKISAGMCILACWLMPVKALWQTETVDAPKFFQNLSDHAAAVDTEGHIHIIYGGDQLYYVMFNGKQWEYKTVDESPASGSFASMSLDRDGYPHATYFNQVSHQVKYIYQDDSGWHSSTIVQLDSNIPKSWIEMDSSSAPHVIYYDSEAGQLKYAIRSGGSWSIETIPDPGIAGEYHSMVLTPDDMPHVSFFSQQDSVRYIRYGYRDAQGWHIETVDNGKFYNGLCVDADGYPHVCYIGSNHLQYAYKNVSGWHYETVESEDYSGKHCSIKLDPSGSPVISHLGTSLTEPKYSFKDANGWHTMSVDPGCYYTDSLSFIYRSGNEPLMVYTSGYFYQLRMAVMSGGVWTSKPIDQCGAPGGEVHVCLNDSGQILVSYIDQISNLIHLAIRDDRSWWIETVDFMDGAINDACMILDRQQQPHVSAYDYNHGEIKHFWRTESGWMNETIDTVFVSYYIDTDCVIDSNDILHVCYAEDVSMTLKHACRVEGVWHFETVDTMGGFDWPGVEVDLAVDALDRLHICYYDDGPDQLKYAWQEEDGWHFLVVDEGAGKYNALAVDQHNNPHVIFSRNDDQTIDYWHKDASGFKQISIAKWYEHFAGLTITIDSSGCAHAGFYVPEQAAYLHAFICKDLVDTDWVDNNGTGLTPDMISDSEGNLYTAYHDGFLADLKFAIHDAFPTPTPLPPTPTPTPEQPTSTPTSPMPSIGVQLEMPSTFFIPDDTCYLKAIIHNQKAALTQVPFFVILEIDSSYWFYPDWSEDAGWATRDVPLGTQTVDIFEPFAWPDTGESEMTGLMFYGAVTDPGITEILGGPEGLGLWEFGYGPR